MSCVKAEPRPDNLLVTLQSDLSAIFTNLELKPIVVTNGNQLALQYDISKDMVERFPPSKALGTRVSPGKRGIVLELTIYSGIYHSQFEMPQVFKNIHWQTYINAVPVHSGEDHIFMLLSWGEGADPALVERIKKLVEDVKQDAPVSK